MNGAIKKLYILILLVATALALGCEKEQTEKQPRDPIFAAAEVAIKTLPDNKSFLNNIRRLEILAGGGKVNDPATSEQVTKPLVDDAYAQAGFICLDAAYKAPESKVAKNLKNLANKFFLNAGKKNPANEKAVIGRFLMKDGKASQKKLLAIHRKIASLRKDEDEFKKNNLIKRNSVYLHLIDIAYNTSTKSGDRFAEKILYTALREYPDDLMLNLKAAQVHFSLEHFANSKSFALHTLELNKKSQDSKIIKQCNYILAEINLREGKFEQPEKFFKKAAVRPDGTHWECAYQALGRIYRSTGRPTKAAAADMKASDMRAGNDSLAYRAAMTCFSIGDHKCAAKYIDRALTVDNKAAYSYLKGFVLLFSEKYEKAKKIFASLENQSDMRAALQIAKGHLALIQGDVYSAMKYFELSMPEVNSGMKSFVNRMGSLGIGWAYANQNKHVKALSYFDRYLEQQPKGIFGLLGKANSMVGLGQIEQGEKLLAQVLEIQPDNSNALAEQAMIYFYRGANAKAEKFLKKALAAGDFRQTCPYEGLGLLYLRQGKIRKAEKYLKKAIELNPAVEYKKYNALADIYIREGKIDQARDLLKKSIENYPFDPRATQMLNELETLAANGETEKISVENIGNDKMD